jgi:hypothetical protein
MSAALTAPFAVAALVLCVAGVAKLRSPRGAAQALAVGGFRVPVPAVRVFAAGELALGAWSLLVPGRLNAAVLACTYAGFAGLSALLARRHAACGCFGDHDAPATALQSLLSGMLAAVALLAAIWTPHGLGWIGGHDTVVLAIGIAGCAYGIVVAYTELPRAWSAWSPR